MAYALNTSSLPKTDSELFHLDKNKYFCSKHNPRCCVKCGLWVHKKCTFSPKHAFKNLSFVCNPCKNKTDDPTDNIWHQFSPLDDHFEESRTVSSQERADFDPDKINPTMTLIQTK